MTTEERLHGPFDSLPRVAVGNEQIIARYQEQLAQLENNASRLLNTLAESEVDPGLQQKLRQYYDTKLQNISNGIAFSRARLLQNGQ